MRKIALLPINIKNKYGLFRKGGSGSLWRRLSVIAGLVFCMPVLAACSQESDYYTDREAVEYVQQVHGSSYYYTDSSYTTDSGGKLVYQYNFTNGEGENFSVYASSGRNGEKKTFYDNYYDQVIETYASEITEAFDNSGLDASLVSDYAEHGYGNIYTLSIYLNGSEDFAAASELIAEVNGIVHFKSDSEASEYSTLSGKTKEVEIYMKPDVPAPGDTSEDWKESELRRNYIVSSISLAGGEETVPDADAILDEMYNDYVDFAKYGGSGMYTLTDEEWDKYPAPWLQVTAVGGNNVSSSEIYRFYYDRATGEYWMSYLDPCQDFEDFPYEYSNTGTFRELVNCLYGSYHADDWNAQWEIGGVTWKAQLQTKETDTSKYAFMSLAVTKDGKAISLSRLPENGNNGTVSGRKLSIKDLISMLNANITVNQKTMTAVIE